LERPTAAPVATVSAGSALAGASGRRDAVAILAGVALAEAALLVTGFLTGHVAAAMLLALGAAYFLFAFRFPDAAWMLVWVAFPFSVELTVPGGSAVSVPSEPMIAASLAAWALRSLLARDFRMARSPLHAPLAAVAGTALLSIFAGHYVVVGLKAWLVAGAYAAFGYLHFLSTPCDARRRSRWVAVAVATGALWALYGGIRGLLLGVSAQSAYGAARPFFREHGTYSAFLCMLLPLALLEALRSGGRARSAYVAATLVITAAVTLSFTRAAWIATAVVVPVTLIVWSRTRRSWRSILVPGLLALAVAGLVAVSGATKSITRHAESVVATENVSNLERVNRWLAAWEMIRDRPWIGVGYGAYPDAYRAYRRKLVLTEESYQHMGVHSEPLRVLSETGIAGFVAVLWLLATASAVGWRTWKRDPDPERRTLALATLAGLATYVVHGFFNAYLGMDKVTVPFWVGLGVLAALGRPAKAES
jgi:O-antigen ligase